ncbi:MAG: hypothetical protein ACO1TE_01525 [Prosthecobacter sp.]
MRALFWIPLAVAGLASWAPAQPVVEVRGDAAISELLSSSVPAEDWHEHLKMRKQAGWVAPPLPSRTIADTEDIEKLAGHWRTDRNWGLDMGKPSAAVRERLVAYCEQRPGLFETLAGHFSASQEGMVARIQKLHDRLANAPEEEAKAALPRVRHWLMTEGGLFRDELKAEAEKYFSAPEDALLQSAFEGLLMLEPETAKELLVLQASAESHEARCTALLRLHVMAGKDSPSGPWREGLQKIVTSAESPAAVRARALKALQPTEWPEKVEWVLGLFKDAALGVVQVSKYQEEEPLALLVKSAPDFWVPKIIPLVGSADRAVHDNAVRCLVQFHLGDKREDALWPLLPWLENPQWAQDDRELLGRLRLLQTLDSVNLPESVPGLLWALEHDEGYGLRAAASALAHYRATQAVPALRKAIGREEDMHHRRFMVDALLKLKGMPLEEQVRAVEQQVALMLAEEKRKALRDEEMNPFGASQSSIAPKDRLMVTAGLVLSGSGEFHTPELAEALVKQVDELRQQGPPELAKAMEEEISLWNTPASARLLAARLKAGRVSAKWLWGVFSADGLPTVDLKSLGDGLPPNTAAIVALLSKDENGMRHILEGGDMEAQAMLLACARLRRAPLPLDEVARLLDSKHILCARGAERYLEAEDSAQARALLQRRFKGEARILGARMGFDPGHHAYGDLGKLQDMLRQRVLSAKKPLEIVALLSAGYWGDSGQIWIEIQGDKAALINDQGHERFRTRELTVAELAEVRGYLSQNQVDELPPLTLSVDDGVQYEYIHLTAEGGRRVFMNNPGSYSMQSRAADEPKLPEEENDSVYVCLVELFKKLVEDKSRLAVGYRIAEEMKGLRIVIPREKDRINAVMRQGGVLMVNKSVPGVEELMGQWTAVTADGTYLPETKADGPALKMRNGGFSDEFMVMDHLINFPWRTEAGGGHVRPATREKDEVKGLWLCREKQRPELIVKGTFANPLTSLDGQWVVAARAAGTHWGDPNDVVRIRMSTREVIPLKLAAADTFQAVATLPHSGEILVARARDEDAPGVAPEAGPEKTEYHLVDPATGALRRVTGEFSPLQDESWRPLQRTGKPDVVWAVVPRRDKEGRWHTGIGRYDLRSFTFTKLIEIPRLYFTSMDVWVDAEAGQIFLAVNGDLLALPLPDGVKQ